MSVPHAIQNCVETMRSWPRLMRDHPYIGLLGRKVVQRFSFLLPHDKSYLGFKHLIRDGEGLFLDVGANDGISARGFRVLNKTYRILSIEPNISHEASLLRLKRQMPRYDFLLVGAGDKSEDLTLHIPTVNGIPIYTEASLSEAFVQRTISEKKTLRWQSSSFVVLERKVRIIPLDGLNLAPDIIKIDVEGFDFQVLLGLVKTIETRRPHILVEFDPDLIDNIESFFTKRHYQLLTYDHHRAKFSAFDKQRELSGYAHHEIKTNIFCIPAESVSGLPTFIS